MNSLYVPGTLIHKKPSSRSPLAAAANVTAINAKE
jgi:hypothetical protein